MIGLEDCQALTRDIQAARAAGERLQPVCEIAGVDARTLQRWQAREGPDGALAGDGRSSAVRPSPSHASNPQERAALLAVANEPRSADVPPARIVPMLADEGGYLGLLSRSRTPAGPQHPAPVLTSSGGQSAHGQPSTLKGQTA